MVFKGFATRLSLRAALLTAALATLAYLLVFQDAPVLTALVAMASIVLLLALLRFVKRTNAEVTRFAEALRYADFGQRFQMPHLGSGFTELGEALSAAIAGFQRSRSEQEASLRHLQALTEQVPVPLVSLFPDGRVALRNNAARRLFGGHTVNRQQDLAAFGADLPAALGRLAPGERCLVVLSADDLTQRALVSATEIVTPNGPEKLLSLQNIQSELDGAQLQAWQDLVRVLTHEIMNSITPVASLARTAATLVDDAIAVLDDPDRAAADLSDVKHAVETVARRSDGLMHFVQAYRELTHLPRPEKRTVRLETLFRRVEDLVASEWQRQAVELVVEVDPASLEVDADPDMLEQVLLNLLRNARQALAGRDGARVALRGRLGRSGRVTIEVSDNGPGVPEDLKARIFVPFFTTRQEGSGVGLALTRQVMLAHGGNVTVSESDAGGARFSLNF